MINYAMILGRVGKKDTKQTKHGGEVTTISVATTKKYLDSSGAKQEQTTWHMVHCFSKLSEIASKYVHVGDLIFVKGDIENRKIETGERAGQYSYSIHANELKFIPHAKKADAQSITHQSKDEEVDDEDIPF